MNARSLFHSLLLLPALVATSARATSWTAPTPALQTGLPPTDTEVLLCLADKAMYLTQGTTWGTHAALTTEPGQALVYTIESGSSYYRLHASEAGNTGYLFLSNTSGDVYVDYNNQTVSYSYWQLAAQQDGTFRISLAPSNGFYNRVSSARYLGWNPSNTDKDNSGNSLGTNVGLFTLTTASSNVIGWRYADAGHYKAQLRLYHLLLEAEAAGVGTSEAGAVYTNPSATLAQLNQASAQLAMTLGGQTVDLSFLIDNPTFDGNTSGWTVSMPGAQNKGYQSATYTNGDVTISQFAEAWISSGRTLGAGTISQTLTDLPAGTYTLEADIIACNQQTGLPAEGVTLFADGALSYETAAASYSGKPQHFTLEFTLSTTGDVTIGLRTTSATTANWVAIDNLSLTCRQSFENHPEALVFNEIQVANLDQYIDPAYCYGAWAELYNPTDTKIDLAGLYVSNDAAHPLKHQLPQTAGIVPAHGYKNLWFDHYDTGTAYSSEAYKQVDFKLDYDGGTLYLSDASGRLLLTQPYPAAVPRTSFARTTDGGGTWSTTGEPTPQASNATSTFATQRLAPPVVNRDATVFSSALIVRVTIPDGATLRYTTDGSTPTLANGQTSTDGRFVVSGGTQVYRFRLFQDGYLPSAVVTRSYIYAARDYYLPIVSVTTAPDNLFDDVIGAYVTGTNGIAGNGIASKANRNRSWERPVNFEYLVPDADQGGYVMALSQECDFEVSGGWTRNLYAPEASFRLTAKKQYEGENFLPYAFFDQKPYLKHKAVQVRNGGNDGYQRIRDAGIQQIVQRSGFYVDQQSWQPAHIFINGQYHYTFNLREPSNKNHGYANYGIDTDLMDQFEINGTDGYKQKTGDDRAMRRWMALAEQLASSPADESLYEEICRLVDIDEYINYMALECYIGSSDWLTNCNNTKGYRAKSDGGRFHLVMFDVDAGFDYDNMLSRLSGSLSDSRYDTGKSFLIDIFLNMLKHEGFKQQFITAFCLVHGSVFESTRSTAIVNEMVDLTAKGLAFNGESASGSASTLLGKITGTSNRYNRMNNMRSYFGLDAGTSVTLASNIDEARLLVNGREVPTGAFDGTFHLPVTLTAQAPAGYRFKGWMNKNQLGITATLTTDSVVTLTSNSSLSSYALTATFERLSDSQLIPAVAMPIKVNEVSAANSVFINEYFKKNDWLELYNTTDTDLDAAGLYVSDDIDNPLKYQIPTGSVVNTIVPARGHLVVWADELEPVAQLHTPFKLGNNNGEMALVTSSDPFVEANAEYFTAHPDLKAFADGLPYKTHGGDQSVGRYPDGGNNLYRMSRPTIERQNSLLTTDELTGVDEGIMDYGQTTFTLDLSEGWNWVSHPLAEALSVNVFKNEADRIQGQTLEAYYNSDARTMAGLLKRLDIGHLYKIDMNEGYTYRFDGRVPSTLPTLPLRAGWNWIGYPATAAQTLAQALATSHAEEGDLIVGQTGFAAYSTADGWTGTLSTLTPGSGYMYRSQRAKAIRFSEPSASAVRLRHRARRSPAETRFGIDRHAYPNVMGLIARVETEGSGLEATALDIVALAGDECRGTGQYAGGCLFLTLYGQGGETLRFQAVDEAGHRYAIRQTIAFASDVVGTMEAPYVLSLADGETGIDAPTEPGRTAQTPTATGTVYDLCGRRCQTREEGRLRPGIYLVRQSDGKYKKVMIK